ncbi:hypothetical protein [Marinomonas mediterranea]|jgi:hypothetical protein|uniref:Uncharacterized protein n=1 Tax=Marinomonas mediterranea (strain ATCC 700492 / JCM 21426 / NBRC 103028 / MMB-1) TaxID=717774 RepID=F2JTH8_MARM1|nr:hypothetical protein [Marinomonas mediterranea]ADZ91492.1 hypothetical protein Marme_2251 [Marinomonas mediterranea MMB-1]WCN09459.1 hypothetical protein GV055_11200 [Marinomonas mediterranea]WCN13535.1 hypothetical protein GV054_11205 [Marinomonas mediterranea]WCN17601.1 hypothetical protein GV053_11315 [Marinomonas mediterranea MMB-1]
MKDAYLEIVELDNGDIVLRPVAEDDSDAPEKPLAVLQIPEDTRSLLKDRYFELAKRMFHAGIDYVYSDDFSDQMDMDMDMAEDMDMMPKVLH